MSNILEQAVDVDGLINFITDNQSMAKNYRTNSINILTILNERLGNQLTASKLAVEIVAIKANPLPGMTKLDILPLELAFQKIYFRN